MRRWIIMLLVLPVLLAACGSTAPLQVRASVSVGEAMNADDTAGFARATAPRSFAFPRDHGPHPDYQIEWWYYTGNLKRDDGRRFGFQLTFFRRGLSANPATRTSAWAAHNIYMAHLALSDISGDRFYFFERFSRDGPDLAGATGEPFHVFLDDWSAQGYGPEGMRMHLRAGEDDIALDLNLESTKPPAFQGDHGLSPKGPTSGNASYYYSLTRMQTSGTLRIADQDYPVEGLSWMDHEFSTSYLEGNAVGWDWFSLQLDDGREVMIQRIRLSNDDIKGAWSQSLLVEGTLINRDGTTRRLDASVIQAVVMVRW